MSKLKWKKKRRAALCASKPAGLIEYSSFPPSLPHLRGRIASDSKSRRLSCSPTRTELAYCTVDPYASSVQPCFPHPTPAWLDMAHSRPLASYRTLIARQGLQEAMAALSNMRQLHMLQCRSLHAWPCLLSQLRAGLSARTANHCRETQHHPSAFASACASYSLAVSVDRVNVLVLLQDTQESATTLLSVVLAPVGLLGGVLLARLSDQEPQAAIHASLAMQSW